MATASTHDSLLDEITGPTPGQMLRKRIFGHQGLLIGAVVLIILTIIAILAPWIAPHDPYAQSLMTRMEPPVFMRGTWEHRRATARKTKRVRPEPEPEDDDEDVCSMCEDEEDA